MRIKYNTLVLILFIIFTLSLFTQEEDEKAGIIKAFYTEYITEKSKVRGYSKKKIAALKEKYIAKPLIKYIKKLKLDYDVFLNAQNCEIKWLDTLIVQKEDENIYTVSFMYNMDKSNTMRISVKKEKGIYKISNILGSVLE